MKCPFLVGDHLITCSGKRPLMLGCRLMARLLAELQTGGLSSQVKRTSLPWCGQAACIKRPRGLCPSTLFRREAGASTAKRCPHRSKAPRPWWFGTFNRGGAVLADYNSVLTCPDPRTGSEDGTGGRIPCGLNGLARRPAGNGP